MLTKIDHLIAPDDIDKAIAVLKEANLIFTRETLKPCPFCGGKAERGQSNVRANAYFVRCICCRVTTGEFEHEASSQKAWNERTLSEPNND